MSHFVFINRLNELTERTWRSRTRAVDAHALRRAADVRKTHRARVFAVNPESGGITRRHAVRLHSNSRGRFRR